MAVNNTRSGMSKRIVFVTFESQFSPLGGLAAVMRVLPKEMGALENKECFIVTPFFRAIAQCQKKIFKQIQTTGKQFEMTFGEKNEDVEVFRHKGEDGFQTLLIDSPDFFNAPCDCGDPPDPNTPCNPYMNPGNPDQLLQDALFFCKAVPEALVQLGYSAHLVFFLQDWETASIALTAKEHDKIQASTCLLTLHNPYDKPLGPDGLSKISPRKLEGPTVLSQMIPLVDGPLSTVSENFAKELISDPLHTRVYAPHLQETFKKTTLVGVNNGVFGELSIPQGCITQVERGDVSLLLEEKNRRRQELITVLEAYQPEQAWGTLEFENFDGPIFLFFGRDDPRQKGYDVASRAIELLPPGLARYVFTPIPGDEGIKGLQFLQRLAQNRRGEVKVFPFRMQRGYVELQRGASYLAMCSLYEPFGGATEGYVAGTPVVARATGGLVQQVCPHPSASLTSSVRDLAGLYHTQFDEPSGFLFREPVLPMKQVVAGWRKIVDCGYWPDGDRVLDRVGTPLFDAVVKQAVQAITDASTLYSSDPTSYAMMIFNGIKLLNRFSWESSVRGYGDLLREIENGKVHDAK